MTSMQNPPGAARRLTIDRHRAWVAQGPAIAAALFGFLTASPLPAVPGFGQTEIRNFTDRYCSSCHNDVDKEGDLDLTTLPFSLAEPANFLTWVKVHDRIEAGEMPPKEKKRPSSADLAPFVAGLTATLIATERETVTQEGRATRRRLNRIEYENALRDLLHAPWLRVQALLPEDGEADHFNKTSAALDVSYVHMAQYMKAADAALREAMGVKLVRPPTKVTRYYARETRNMISGDVSFKFEPFTGFIPDRLKFPALGAKAQPDVRANQAPLTVGASDPATRDQEAIGWVSGHLVTGFGTGWSSFIAPVAGRYRLRFSGYTLWVGPGGHSTALVGTGKNRTRKPNSAEWFKANYDDVSPGRRSEPISVFGQTVALTPLSRRLGGFDLSPEPSVNELEVWMQAKEWVVTDAARFYHGRPVTGTRGYTNPLAQKDGQPAVAFQWMEVEGPLYDDASDAGYRLMFGNLPLERKDNGSVTLDVVQPVPPERRGPPFSGSDVGYDDFILGTAAAEVSPARAGEEAERLLREFIARAYRRPVEEKEVQRFLGLIKRRLETGAGFASAMLAGYTAILSSPEFVYINEKPGRLDDHALATRLALFLWNSEPDATLRLRAARGELHRPEVLRAETDRMLADPRSRRFVESFLDYWLEIKKMDDTTPSYALYPDYVLDDLLMASMVEETRLYFSELILRDLPARAIVDSDFAFLNERLARHYGISGVEGSRLRRVSLPAHSPRGGLITQASVLKVTANGTTTSPVLRGKWIMERIVGFDLPPPPAAVPAVEPDTRGAVTIRQQLDKHRADESCAVCHRKIDPPGFALENFDVMGGWRDRYRATSALAEPELGFGRNGWPYEFHYAQPIDASGQLVDGRAFADIRELKRLLVNDQMQLARNLARQFSVYATGATVRFGDRLAIERILQAAKPAGYGVRSLLHALIASDLFLNK